MSTHAIRYKSGFTLLELIVVLSLMGIVSTIGMTGFFRMTQHFNTLQENMRLNKSAANTFDMMLQDFENILSGRVTGSPLQGIHADTEVSLHFWRITFEDDTLSFPVEVLNPLTQQRERLLVNYAVERGINDPRLVRTTSSLQQPDATPNAIVVAGDVAGMRLQYYDGDTWHGEWSKPVHPDLVRVSLSLIAGNRTDGQLARTATFALQVQ
jgi:prepilin-type N-terminal cleavage/methylation domain-containing protein